MSSKSGGILLASTSIGRVAKQAHPYSRTQLLSSSRSIPSSALIAAWTLSSRSQCEASSSEFESSNAVRKASSATTREQSLESGEVVDRIRRYCECSCQKPDQPVAGTARRYGMFECLGAAQVLDENVLMLERRLLTINEVNMRMLLLIASRVDRPRHERAK